MSRFAMASLASCSCRNACSRSSKRGACPCRQASRTCTPVCTCGTQKVCCTNITDRQVESYLPAVDMETDQPIPVEISFHSSGDEWQSEERQQVDEPTLPSPAAGKSKKRKKANAGTAAKRRLLMCEQDTATRPQESSTSQEAMDWEATAQHTARVTNFVQQQDLSALQKITTELFLRAPSVFEDYAAGYHAGTPGSPGSDLPDTTPPWCKCGQCQPMPTAVENKCCHRDQKTALPRGQCVTRTELFRGSVLNPTFVNTMMAGYYDILAQQRATTQHFGTMPTEATFSWPMVLLGREIVRLCHHVVCWPFRDAIPTQMANTLALGLHDSYLHVYAAKYDWMVQIINTINLMHMSFLFTIC